MHQIIFFKIEIKNFHMVNETLNECSKIKKFDYELKNHSIYLKWMCYDYKKVLFKLELVIYIKEIFVQN